MVSTALVPSNGRAELAVSPEPDSELDLVKRLIAKGATDNELLLFGEVCKRTGLDPFTKQIYAVKRWDSDAKREVLAVQIGVDGHRIIAQRTGAYAGQDGPWWCGVDGVWTDVWLEETPPRAARVIVRRVLPDGQIVTATGLALYAEFVQKTRDGKPNAMWRTMPANQLAKCAECQGLRKLFGAEITAAQAQLDEVHISVEEEPLSAGTAPGPTRAALPAATGQPRERVPAAGTVSPAPPRTTPSRETAAGSSVRAELPAGARGATEEDPDDAELPAVRAFFKLAAQAGYDRAAVRERLGIALLASQAGDWEALRYALEQRGLTASAKGFRALLGAVETAATPPADEHDDAALDGLARRVEEALDEYVDEVVADLHAAADDAQ